MLVVSMRERLAGWLHRTGAFGAVMQLRKFAPIPQLSIVTYHHIADDDPAYPYDASIYDATPAQFRRQMEMLARYGTPIGIDELVRAVDGAPLPKNPVMVTFDDGYLSCHDVALPILRAVGMRATFFVSTTFITERRLYWWERISLLVSRATQPRVKLTYPKEVVVDTRDAKVREVLTDLVKDTPSLDVELFLEQLAAAFGVEWNREIEAEFADGLIMKWDHVRALARAGMDVESHGRRHRVLQTLSDRDLDDELSGSRLDLEQQLNRPIRAIAYPVGRRIAHEPRLRDAMASAGYRVGFSNSSGVNRLWPASLRAMVPLDPFDVRRLATDRRMSDGMFLSQIAVPAFAYISKNHVF
jgi:peptidoglycan/xylan/chitin deacetylase (PgdA/CDA1 family)